MSELTNDEKIKVHKIQYDFSNFLLLNRMYIYVLQIAHTETVSEIVK